MIIIKRQFTRPSVDIPWHSEILPSEEFKLKRQVYIDSGKLVLHSITYSENGLQMFYEGIWASQADYDEYTSDPDLTPHWNIRNSYNESVGIIIGPKITE
jgi:hypothetical protein